MKADFRVANLSFFAWVLFPLAGLPLILAGCDPAEKKEGISSLSVSERKEDAVAVRELARKFYELYLQLEVRGLPDDSQLAQLLPLLDDDLRGLLEKAKTEQEEAIRKSPDEKPPWSEGDLFSSLFEGAGSFELGEETIGGNRAEIPILLKYTETNPGVEWSDLLMLERESDGWKVSDILFKGEWAFKSASLKSGLRQP